ncbi:MAG: ROK family protein [Gemmataceae bacterium]
MTVLACDLGGTRIKIGLVHGGAVLAADVLAAHSDRGLRARLPALAEACRSLCARHGTALTACAGLAVSFPSLVDVRTGHILAEYGKYRDGPEVDLRVGTAGTGTALAIENDARMALIGEWRHGAGRGCDNLVMVTLGTGLGTSAVIEGRVLRGRHGQAGCLGGHLTLRYGGRDCGCGNAGCAEAEASTAFLAHVARGHAAFPASPLAGEAVLDYAAVFRHAAAGDPCAAALRDHSLLVWSSLVVNLIHAYDPEVVILGGGIMASADVILPAVCAHVAGYAHTPWGKVRIVASELGDGAALAAAEWLVEEQAEYA